MGCSIGGRIVLNLAIDHAAEFRALIGLEGADFQAPWYDTSWLNRPDVHGGEVCAALVSGLIAPQSPDSSRAETLWAYKQGGPGVFKGDLYFYRVDGDLRGRVEKIDTKVCPLFLLTGEYDFSCTPEDTKRTAAAIAGASVTIMEQLGHFPMSENPEQFRRYISPVLDQIWPLEADCGTNRPPRRQGDRMNSRRPLDLLWSELCRYSRRIRRAVVKRQVLGCRRNHPASCFVS